MFRRYGDFKCQCGRKFNNLQKFLGHKTHCRNKAKNEKKKVLKQIDDLIRRTCYIVLKCKKCNTCFAYRFGSLDFCSINCSNSRKHSKETKNKISETFKHKEKKKKVIEIKIVSEEIKCVECGQQFISIHSYKNNSNFLNFCSKECQNKNIGNKISKSRKQLFEEGKLKLTGGKTQWFDYKDIRVQGSFELRTCKILDKLKDENKIIDWVYAPDRFEYIGEDLKKHTYRPDFKIFVVNKTKYLEVKGHIYDLVEVLLKLQTVRNKGFEIDVWFLQDIERNEATLAQSVEQRTENPCVCSSTLQGGIKI